MEGMLKSLVPYANLQQPSTLNPRLQALLTRNTILATEEKLKKRQSKIQVNSQLVPETK
jgi:hypothetical protein